MDDTPELNDENEDVEEIEFEELTPTHKRFGVPVGELLDRVELQGLKGFDNFNAEFVSTIALLIDDPGLRQRVDEGVRQAIGILEGIAKSEEHPELADQVRMALVDLSLSIFNAANEIACQAIALESSTQGNIYRANALKGEQVEKARLIAQQLWDADSDREFRLKDAAEVVRDTLAREGLSMPGIEQVKKWIRSVAPDYATKGGRPRKT